MKKFEVSANGVPHHSLRHMDKTDYSHFLTTAGGRINCRRCQATSRSGQQCLKPAVLGRRVCRSHGGGSTGARTAEGIQKIRQAHLKHGGRSAAGVEKARLSAIKLRKLGDALFVLGLIQGNKIPGRWPDGYRPLETMDDVKQFASELILDLME
jgi:hypothetical protein